MEIAPGSRTVFLVKDIVVLIGRHADLEPLSCDPGKRAREELLVCSWSW